MFHSANPCNVAAIRPEDNTVVLGDADEIFATGLTASDPNFISIEELKDEMRVSAKIRYSAKAAPAVIRPADHGRVEVVFDEPQKGHNSRPVCSIL